MAKRATRLVVAVGFVFTLASALSQETGQQNNPARDAAGRPETQSAASDAAKPDHSAPPPHPCRSRPGLAPEMVLIEAATFMMGSPEDEAGRASDEGQRRVTLTRPYGIGRCEVTVDEYRLFVSETNYKTEGNEGTGCYVWSETVKKGIIDASADWSSPGFPQNGDHPVVCVNWKDAKQYARWLSLRTDIVYRLPTEAEWEYAARGRTHTAYWWGDEVRRDGKVWANCDGCGSPWDKKGTAPVGQFPANPFGLLDTAGNVWEWVEDCWHLSASGAPEDGSRARGEADGGDCSRRVVRGGGWIIEPDRLRSALRSVFSTDDVYNTLGFRLARDL